jgi:hypothetical protein
MAFSPLRFLRLRKADLEDELRQGAPVSEPLRGRWYFWIVRPARIGGNGVSRDASRESTEIMRLLMLLLILRW